MTFERNNQVAPREEKSLGGAKDRRGEPGWANGLKQLYDSVVDEDLPDTFKDLLSQLDRDDRA